MRRLRSLPDPHRQARFDSVAFARSNSSFFYRLENSQNARRGDQNTYVLELAGVAELADALDSKSSDRKIVWVRTPPPASFLEAYANSSPRARARTLPRPRF